MLIKGWYAIVLTGIVIPVPVASAGKSDIAINETGLWITPENFSSMIEESLKESKCSHVHISGDSVAINTIFNDFVRIYPHEYIIMNRSHHCSGYFMISTSANRIATIVETIPTKSAIEILIIIDNDVVESSMLFNVSMYQHANVNIAARSGMWTLSENYLEPRTFKRIESPQEVVHERRIVNLRGRKLQVAAFYQQPACYLKSTVNFTVKGVEVEFFVANNETELDGMEVKIFLLIAERLNFTWMIRTPNSYFRYGRRNGTDWNGGIIGQIFRKEVDIAFTNIWLTLDYYKFTNMSHPLTLVLTHFAVPRPKSYRSFWALTKIFSVDVWAAFFVMLFLQSAYVCTRARIIRKTLKRYRNFVITLTEMMGRLVGVAQRIRGFRLQILVWHFVGILLVTAYSSNLAARLTNASYEKRIDTLQDFIAANLTWGREQTVATPSKYFDENDPYVKQILGRLEMELDENERHRKVLRGNYAIFGKTVRNMFFPEYYLRDEDFQGYRVMKESTANHFTSFATQPWLVEPVNKVVLELREAGFIRYHIDDVIHRRTGPELRDVVHEHDVGLGVPTVLSLIPLGFGFSILILGLVLSSIIFYLELHYGSEKGSFSRVLRWIKRNRDIQNGAKITRQNRYPTVNRISGKKYGYALLRKKLSGQNDRAT